MKKQLLEIVDILREDEKRLDLEDYREMLESIRSTEVEWKEILKIARSVRLITEAPDFHKSPYKLHIDKMAL